MLIDNRYGGADAGDRTMVTFFSTPNIHYLYIINYIFITYYSKQSLSIHDTVFDFLSSWTLCVLLWMS